MHTPPHAQSDPLLTGCGSCCPAVVPTAEIILADCVSMVKEDGSSVPLSAEKRAELEAYITKLAKQSLRTIWCVHACDSLRRKAGCSEAGVLKVESCQW